MATNDEKQAFAGRLILALKRSRKKISTPSELSVQFNLQYSGNPITPQAAQKWMSGQNRPSPDKIETLAAMLNTSHQWLRYGIPESIAVARQPSSPSAASNCAAHTPEDLLLLSRLLALPEHQQYLIKEIIDQFAVQQGMWQG